MGDPCWEREWPVRHPLSWVRWRGESHSLLGVCASALGTCDVESLLEHHWKHKCWLLTRILLGLLLHNNMTTNLAAYNSTYLLLQRFCGWGVWAWLTWVFCFTRLQSRCWLGLCFQAHMATGRIQVHVGWWTEGLSSLLVFDHGPPIVSCYVGFPDMAAGFIKASKGATPSKMDVGILCNIIMEMTSCSLGNILLVKSKS